MAVDNLLIVVREDDSSANDFHRAAHAGDEPEFRLSGVKSLRVAAGPDRDKTLDYFCYRVARSPEDLASHLRRLFFCYEQGLEEDLYGAFRDLFVVLDDKGRRLKQRMLNGAAKVLRENHYAALSRCLSGGSVHDLPYSPASVVAARGGEVMRLLVSKGSVDDKVDDPLKVARDHIEYSQLPEALAVLEQAILVQPMRKELHLDLLQLYRSTRDRTKFQEMLKQIDLSQNPVPEAWEEAINYFQLTENHAG